DPPRSAAPRAPALRPPSPLGAARLLAQPRGGLLHLPVPAAAFRAPRLGLLGEVRARAGGLGGPRRAHQLRVREHRLRRPCDSARPATRERDPQAAPLDTVAARDL